MSKKRIWIVSEVFYPEEVATAYIMTCIAQKIAETDEVHVICGPIGYDKIMSDEDDNNFKFTVNRVATLNFSKNNIIGRLIRLVVLSFGMFFKGLFLIKEGDTIFIVTNPAFIVPFFAIIKKLKKSKLIILVHDIFPENLIPPKIINSKKNILYKIAKRMFDWSYQQADHLIVLGADMLEVMKTKTKKGQ